MANVNRKIIVKQQRLFRSRLLLIDALILAVMLGKFQTLEGGYYRLFNQILAVLVVTVYARIHLKLRLHIPPEYLVESLFIAWCFLSGIFAAVDQSRMIVYLVMLARFVVFTAAVSGSVIAKRSPNFGFIVVVISATYLSIWARLSGVFEQIMIGNMSYFDLGINPNTIGLTAVWGSVGVVFLWRSTNRRWIRISLLCIGILNVFTLISSASRKSFVGLLLFLSLWYLFCYFSKSLKNQRYIIFGIFCVLGFYYVVVTLVPQTRLGERLNMAVEERSIGRSREGMYREGLRLFLDQPLIGVGLGNFGVRSSYRGFSHSDYIEILSSTGLVGFCLHFSVYIILWKRISRIKRRSRNSVITYQMGFYQALILTILAIGIGVPGFLNLDIWFVLALMIGHSMSIDRDLSVLRQRTTGRWVPVQVLGTTGRYR